MKTINPNINSLIALLLATIITTVYITRELSNSHDLLKEIDDMKHQRVDFEQQLDSLHAQLIRKDTYLVGQIDTLYGYLDMLNERRNFNTTQINRVRLALAEERAYRNGIIASFDFD